MHLHAANLLCRGNMVPVCKFHQLRTPSCPIVQLRTPSCPQLCAPNNCIQPIDVGQHKSTIDSYLLSNGLGTYMRILKHTPVPVGCTTFKQVEPGGEIDQPNQSEACFGEMEKVI